MSRPGVIDVCAFAELADGDARGFTIPDGDYDGFPVRQGDTVAAYLNTCPHQGHPLNWKPDAFLTRNRELIMCSVHGAIFDKGSGLCVGGPCVGKALRPLVADIVDGRVLVQAP
jgi:nitrite reductase/ring-hydroxylating ferredoxin subunit